MVNSPAAPSPSPTTSRTREPALTTDDETRILEDLRHRPQLLDEIQQNSGPEFALQTRLRKTYPDDLVRAALSLVELRKKGAAKFSRADRMWFDRVGLEQATPEPVARHKALRFENVDRPVWDLCAGIGADALHLAGRGSVIAVDRREAALWRTARNAEVYGTSDRLETRLGDVTALDLAGKIVHIDPDRRAGKSAAKTVRIEESEPGLEFLQQLIAGAAGGAIKLSPAANFGGKFPEAEVELVSLAGECKEATIWFGSLRSETQFRATVLTPGAGGDLRDCASATLTGDPWSARGEIRPLEKYLCDPDPAVVRGGLVDVLSETSSLGRLDPEEEYLTSEALPDSPFVTPFEVLADLSNNDREIRAYFRGSEFGQLEIKCRHVPVDVEALRKKLPLPGREAGVLLFARVAGRTRAVVARRLPRVVKVD